MSSMKQELAAILIQYADRMDDTLYKNILEDLAKIPNHKDPKAAAEIQKELDEANRLGMIKDDEIYCYQREIDDLNVIMKHLEYENNMLRRRNIYQKDIIDKNHIIIHCLQNKLEEANQTNFNLRNWLPQNHQSRAKHNGFMDSTDSFNIDNLYNSEDDSEYKYCYYYNKNQTWQSKVVHYLMYGTQNDMPPIHDLSNQDLVKNIDRLYNIIQSIQQIPNNNMSMMNHLNIGYSNRVVPENIVSEYISDLIS